MFHIDAAYVDMAAGLPLLLLIDAFFYVMPPYAYICYIRTRHRLAIQGAPLYRQAAAVSCFDFRRRDV